MLLLTVFDQIYHNRKRSKGRKNKLEGPTLAMFGICFQLQFYPCSKKYFKNFELHALPRVNAKEDIWSSLINICSL